MHVKSMPDRIVVPYYGPFSALFGTIWPYSTLMHTIAAGAAMATPLLQCSNVRPWLVCICAVAMDDYKL